MILPTQFTNAAPFPAARAAGPAPKPANSLAGLPVAHPFHSAADRLPAAETARREVDSSPTSLRHPSALELFRSGLDTFDIAKRLGITEARASRLVHVQRSEALGLLAHSEPYPRWGRR